MPAPQSQLLRDRNDKASSESSTIISCIAGVTTLETAKGAASIKCSDVSKLTSSSKSIDYCRNTDVLKCSESSKGLDAMKSNDLRRSSSSESPETEVLWSKGGCTVQFERRFIEVDDELVSVITDIEGKFLSNHKRLRVASCSIFILSVLLIAFLAM